MDASGIKCARFAKGAKVPGFKGARVSRCQCLKVQRVTRVPRLKGLLRDRLFSRTHLRSSLTPEEGPSCVSIIMRMIQLINNYLICYRWKSVHCHG